MLHIDQGGSRDVCRFFFDGVCARDVDFDIIGLSYYPFWHGTLSDLAQNLAFLSDVYEKDIIIVETGHDWNGQEQPCLAFPHTPDGQLDFLMALIHTVAASPGGKGIFYWAPEWIMGEHWHGPAWSNVWENRAMFDRQGNALPSIHAFEASRTWK